MDKKSKLHYRRRNQIKLKGYVALIMVLMVSVLLLVIGISVALISINQGQMSTVEQKKEAELAFVESCAAEVLLKLDKYRVVPSSVTLPTGTCSVSSSRTGFSWNLTITGSLEGYTKSVQINVLRTTHITINSWVEI